MARGDDAPFPIAARSLGVGFLAPLLWLLPAVSTGGLAPIAVAGVVAILLGAPSALTQWRLAPPLDPRARVLRESAAEVAGLVALALALVSVDRSWVGLGLAVSAWPLGAVLARRPWLLFVAAAAALGLAAAGALAALQVAPPTTLLDPRWEAAPGWIGAALPAGVLLAGAGSGQWIVGPARAPGQRRAPWAAVGAGLLFAACVATERGARFEALIEGDSAAVTAATWLALLAASGALFGRTGLEPRARLATGVALTLGLAAIGAAGHALLVSGALPLAAAALLAPLVRLSGVARVAPACAVIGCGVGVWASWPGLPVEALDAVGVAVVGVAAFWFLATRTVLARRETA